MWTEGTPWDEISEMSESSEGDVVRIFKRTVDILRQISSAEFISPVLNQTAKQAVELILKEPVDAD